MAVTPLASGARSHWGVTCAGGGDGGSGGSGGSGVAGGAGGCGGCAGAGLRRTRKVSPQKDQPA